MSALLRIGLLVVLAATAAGVAVVLAVGARTRGKLTHCRNNLRFLGELAYQRLSSGGGREEPDDLGVGRTFWQTIRREHYFRRNPRLGKDEWTVRFAGLNPFGCPVLGRQPEDLSRLTPEERETHMIDPETIDYRGPRNPSNPTLPRGLRILGADRPGNHPRGGHVLRVDLSVDEIRKAADVRGWKEVPGFETDLAD